jgi:hypothetical protein
VVAAAVAAMLLATVAPAEWSAAAATGATAPASDGVLLHLARGL